MHRFRRIRNIVVIWALITIPHVFAHPAEGFGQNSPLRTEGSSSSKGFDLEKAARKRFPHLSEAERTLLKAVPIGDAVVCTSPHGRPPENSEPDSELYTSNRPPARLPCWLSTQATNPLLSHEYLGNYLNDANAWEPDRTIRAKLIRWLAVDPNASKQIDPKGLWIMGARLSGPFDFGFVSMRHPLVLRWCSIPEGLNLQDATLQRLDLEHSHTTLLQAQNLLVRGDCLLRRGFEANRVNLYDARIRGTLDLDGSNLTDACFTALELQEAEVDNSLWLNNNMKVWGSVHLPGANIHGHLLMNSGSFQVSDDCDKAAASSRFDSSADGIAINASNLTVSEGVYSDPHTLVVGFTDLSNSSVGGDLHIEGKFSPAKKSDPKDDLIGAFETDVKGKIVVSMTSSGSVDLNGDEIGTHLIVKNAALGAGARLLLTAVNIKHTLEIDSFQLAKGAKLFLTDSNATVLEYDAPLPKPDEIDFDGFTYQRLRFGEPEMRETYSKWINLVDAGSKYPPQPYRQLAKVLADLDEDASRDVMIQMEDRQFKLPGWVHWPRKIVQAPVDLVFWLFGSLGLSFVIGIAIILALWRVTSAKVAGAAFFGLAMLTWLVWTSRHDLSSSALLLKMTIEYGYVPLLALFWSAVIVAFGWRATLMAREADVLAPSKDNDAGKGEDGKLAGKEPLNAFLYSLNLFLPIVDLHQEKNWWPDATRSGNCQPFGRGKPRTLSGAAVRSYFWLQIILGWVLSGFFIAGFSGLIKHG